MDISDELRDESQDNPDSLYWRAADEIDRLRAEVSALRAIESAARNLVAVKGRHHSEIAYQRLVEALNGEVSGASRNGEASSAEGATSTVVLGNDFRSAT